MWGGWVLGGYVCTHVTTKSTDDAPTIQHNAPPKQQEKDIVIEKIVGVGSFGKVWKGVYGDKVRTNGSVCVYVYVIYMVSGSRPVYV